MILYFKDMTFDTRELYPAVITTVEEDKKNGRFRIKVNTKKYPQNTVWKSVPLEMYKSSQLYELLDYLGGVVADGKVNTKHLEGMNVFVSMSKGQGQYGRYYVQDIYLPEDVETEEPDETDDYEEEDDYDPVYCGDYDEYEE